MNLLEIYSTPIWKIDYPDFQENKKYLLEILTNYKKETIGEEIVNLNNLKYQSPSNIQNIEELRSFFEFICICVNNALTDLDLVPCNIAITTASININHNNIVLKSDYYRDEVFSGCFHIHVPENSGKLIIKNPGINSLWNGCTLSNGKNQFTSDKIKIDPEEGQIIIWPSYLSPYMELNDHDEERISISFNAILLPIKPNE